MTYIVSSGTLNPTIPYHTTFESNRDVRFEFKSNLETSQVPTQNLKTQYIYAHSADNWHYISLLNPNRPTRRGIPVQ